MSTLTTTKIASRPSQSASGSYLSERLARHMARPQRHRLLHGFPLAAAMPFLDQATRKRAAEGDPTFDLRPELDRELLIGVLPHPFCNPQVSGCGYCTFPHEKFQSQAAHRVVDGVIREIHDQLTSYPALSEKKVSALYLGGGTANLTPSEPFGKLTEALALAFDLRDAEISLEGVPAYFVRRRPALVDIMREHIPARHFRISMGMQTFSEKWLERMGRKPFGGASTFADAVQVAHVRNMTASGDLLFNLPGQSLDEMKQDVRRAVDIGLDQICLYHLVMFRGLGTPWARDTALLAMLPTNQQACENWLELRELLIGLGYRQNSLTNFEKAELQNDDRRYQYESLSYEPERCQMLGFGPSGISVVTNGDGATDLKTMNPESARQYLQCVEDDGPTWNRHYEFDESDRKGLPRDPAPCGSKDRSPEVPGRFSKRSWKMTSQRN